MIESNRIDCCLNDQTRTSVVVVSIIKIDKIPRVDALYASALNDYISHVVVESRRDAYVCRNASDLETWTIVRPDADVRLCIHDEERRRRRRRGEEGSSSSSSSRLVRIGAS